MRALKLSTLCGLAALLAWPAAGQTAAPLTVAELLSQGYEVKATPLMELLLLQKSAKIYLCRFRPVQGEIGQIAKAFGSSQCAPI